MVPPSEGDAAPVVDVVVVSHNSRETLRACVEPLAGRAQVTVTVVDTASADDGFDTIADLDLRLDRAERNGGFAYGCNRGAAAGVSPYILLLNPDARLVAADLMRLVALADQDPAAGIVGPRLLNEDGAPEPSMRRSPSVRRMLSTALFLHRLAPRAEWSDEVIRDPARYTVAAQPDWLSGACMLIRREAFAAIGGLDEGFFLYAEDTDLCLRMRDAGWNVRFEPSVTAIHVGGASAPRDALRIVDVRSRIRLALIRDGEGAARRMALAIALFQVTHAVVRAPRGGAPGHIAGLRAALAGVRDPRRVARLAGTPPWEDQP